MLASGYFKGNWQKGEHTVQFRVSSTVGTGFVGLSKAGDIRLNVVEVPIAVCWLQDKFKLFHLEKQPNDELLKSYKRV